jgi:hypothetical protein
MSKSPNHTSITIATAEEPQPSATPEQVIEQLRTLRSTLPGVAPLTAKERRAVRSLIRASDDVLQAQIDVIGASDKVSKALGQESTDVRGTADEQTRWMSVEHEVKALLNAISGANLMRAQKLQLVAAQGYQIARSLARDPENAELIPHVAEVRRLKRIDSRKAQTPETPSPEPSPAPETPGSHPSGT